MSTRESEAGGVGANFDKLYIPDIYKLYTARELRATRAAQHGPRRARAKANGLEPKSLLAQHADPSGTARVVSV